MQAEAHTRPQDSLIPWGLGGITMASVQHEGKYTILAPDVQARELLHTFGDRCGKVWVHLLGFHTPNGSSEISGFKTSADKTCTHP